MREQFSVDTTNLYAWIGVPLKVEKMEGPTEILIFFGVLIDMSKMERRLPVES